MKKNAVLVKGLSFSYAGWLSAGELRHSIVTVLHNNTVLYIWNSLRVDMCSHLKVVTRAPTVIHQLILHGFPSLSSQTGNASPASEWSAVWEQILSSWWTKEYQRPASLLQDGTDRGVRFLLLSFPKELGWSYFLAIITFSHSFFPSLTLLPSLPFSLSGIRILISGSLLGNPL